MTNQIRNVTIDLRMINCSGIGTYLKNIIPIIIDNLPKVRFFLLGDNEELGKFTWCKSNNLNLVECHTSIFSVNEQLSLFRKIPKYTDLLWMPQFNIPLLYKGKLLVTIHDVIHLSKPQYVGGIHKQLYAKLLLSAVRNKASKVICVSQFTKTELISLAGFDEENVRDIHIGVDKSWFNIQKDLRPYSRPYILFVGNIKPNKNVVNLLKAFKLLQNRLPYDLVIVGKREGFRTGDKNAFNELQSIEDRVKFTGYIDDSILKQYYAHAEILLFPSLYEGFGLPPLEAMACGCPVITSNVASMPEVCGKAALYCNPHSNNDIAEKILYLVNNNEIRAELVSEGKARARQFSWSRCAAETLEVISRLLHT